MAVAGSVSVLLRYLGVDEGAGSRASPPWGSRIALYLRGAAR